MSSGNDSDINRYKIIDHLGKGNFATVYRVIDKQTDITYAAKVANAMIDDSSQDSDEILSLFREVNLMSLLDHPTIIKFIGYFPTNFTGDPVPTFITELAINGSLLDIIKLQNSGLTPHIWDDTKRLINIYGIAVGMQYLHSHNILHRDLKVDNILMDEDYHPKIADFGLSKITDFLSITMNAQSHKGMKGTPIYCAPEILRDEIYSKAGDVYAYAFIVYEIMTGEIPFQDLNFIKLIKKIVNEGSRPEIGDEIPNAYKELIKNCWSQNPDDRPTFDTIVDELKNNEEFITDSVDQIEFEDYIDFIDSYEATFDVSKRIVHFSDFIKTKNERKTDGNKKEKQDIKENYIFYCTGCNKDMLMEGIEIELDNSMTPDVCRKTLLNCLKDKFNIEKKKKLLIYLSGGIPFNFGTIGSLMIEKSLKARNVIYGVLIDDVSNYILDKIYYNLCDSSDIDHKSLLSPLCKSSSRGVAQMACLLGYLSHNGKKSNALLECIASFVHFPPLITSLIRIIDINRVKGSDIITVCSTIFSYLRFCILSSRYPDDQILENVLKVFNILTHICYTQNNLPITYVEIDPENVKDFHFLVDLKLQPNVYIWGADFDKEFEYQIAEISEESIENSFNLCSVISPILPIDIRTQTSCSIVEGKSNEYLYVMPSQLKKHDEQNNVEIINPMTGIQESIEIEMFAKYQLKKRDSIEIDPSNIKQIIMINFDESKAMIGDWSGYIIRPKSDKTSLYTIALQYITTFVNKIYSYRIPSVQGLISFNNNVFIRSFLTPFLSDIEYGLRKIRPDSICNIWKSIERSIEEIVKFKENKKCKNAISRILAISCVRSTNQPKNIEFIVKALIKNKIVVDTVFIGDDLEEENAKLLCAVSHITGGISIQIKDIKEGINLFEQDSFINYEERRKIIDPLIPKDIQTIPSRITVEMINEDFITKVKENSKFDKEVINDELINSSLKVSLETPKKTCDKNSGNLIPSPKSRRVLREVHRAAQINDPNSPNYDPDMKFCILQSDFEKWRVFIKGQEGTPYENKWWYLSVTFPDQYPHQPPNIRFASIPYHLNVSSEGRICLDILGKNYMSSLHVTDILQEIKQIFLIPDLNNALRLEILDLFIFDRNQYYKLAKESSDKNDLNLSDFLNNADDTVSDYFSINHTEVTPLYMVSQISGKIIKKNKLIMASSGVFYDVDELRQLVASSKNPICVITGQRLNENIEDIE